MPANKKARKRKKKLVPLTEDQKELVEKNIRLISLATNSRRSKVMSRRDQDQCGALTMLNAAKKYRPSRGVKFSTYAVNSIKKSMTQFEADEGVIRVPCYMKEKGASERNYYKYAVAACSPSSIDSDVQQHEHPASPEDEEAEFGYRAMRAVRWAVQKLPPVERDIIRGVVFRGESLTHMGKKHGMSYVAAHKVKLQAFAKLRASLQKHV